MDVNSRFHSLQLAPLPLLLLLLFQCVGVFTASLNRTKPQMPALMVFGDSIVDPGNNNVIETIAKCNFPPYGIDFKDRKPTGRFSNGKIPTDFIASRLGVKEFLPAYLGTNLSPQDILTGVSFASGATGYDPLTPVLQSVISMPAQLKLFAEYKAKLKAIAGTKQAASIVADSLYIVCSGTDDIANTYYSTPFRQQHYDIPSYVNLMISSASSFIQELYKAGARKIGFIGLPPIGCLPSQRTLAGGKSRICAANRNQAALLYNSKMKEEINRLKNTVLKGTKMDFLDIYGILMDIVQRPTSYGFQVSTKGCCGTGLLEASVLCNSVTSSVCADDTEYVFWDSYHPTEKAYSILVDYLYTKYINNII